MTWNKEKPVNSEFLKNIPGFIREIKELLENAADEGLEKLTADVVADQGTALEVFSRLGFRKEAVLKEYVLDSEGVKHDLVMMIKDVGE